MNIEFGGEIFYWRGPAPFLFVAVRAARAKPGDQSDLNQRYLFVCQTALKEFSHALRRELAGTGIGVSVVLPGWTRTAMLAKMDFGEMRRTGLLTPWTTVDDPAVPARAIVDAVRNNRYQVRLGGVQFLFGDLFHRLSLLLLDWYYSVFWNKKQAMKVLRDLG
jgi:hypothetical protein